MVHPTDFDDELASQIDQGFNDRDGSATLHSRYNVEKIEWIVINGKEAGDSAMLRQLHKTLSHRCMWNVPRGIAGF